MQKYEKFASATDNTFDISINEICQGVKSRGTLKDIENVTSFDMVRVSFHVSQLDNVDIWLNHSNLELPGKKFKYFLTEREHECVSQMYTFVLGQNIIVPNGCWKIYSLRKAGETYGCLQSRNVRSANILAYWVGNDGNTHYLNKIDLTPRPGEVEFFPQQTVYKNNQANTFILVKVLWLLPASPQLMEHFGKPVHVWRYQLHERFGPATFIPVQRIRSKYVHVPTKIRGLDVTIVLP